MRTSPGASLIAQAIEERRERGRTRGEPAPDPLEVVRDDATWRSGATDRCALRDMVYRYCRQFRLEYAISEERGFLCSRFRLAVSGPQFLVECVTAFVSRYPEIRRRCADPETLLMSVEMPPVGTV